MTLSVASRQNLFSFSETFFRQRTFRSYEPSSAASIRPPSYLIVKMMQQNLNEAKIRRLKPDHLS